jgi:hypothetical protein
MTGCRICGYGEQRLCDVHRLERHDDDEWDPEPAQLREGETRDDDNAHARTNAEQVELLTEGDDDD